MNSPIYTIASRSQEQVPASRMGRILVEQGRIDPVQAERIAAMQKERGMRYGEAARSLNLVSEADIQRVLAQQFGHSFNEAATGVQSELLVAAYAPDCAEAEILRSIRTQVITRWFGRGHRWLSVAAVNPGDGNSVFVANLAIAFSQLGMRTLLIDAHLRRPRQHQLFGLNSALGLTDMLSGRIGMEAVQNPENLPLLAVVPAGALPASHVEVARQDAFSHVQKRLSESFDVILVDTPPFATTADAHAIAARIGGVLLVARKNTTRVADVSALSTQLAANGIAGVGSVLLDF